MSEGEPKTYYIKPETIRNLLRRELEGYYNQIIKLIDDDWSHDACKKIAIVGFNGVTEELKLCATYEDLERFIYAMNYGMTLQEWIDTL